MNQFNPLPREQYLSGVNELKSDSTNELEWKKSFYLSRFMKCPRCMNRKFSRYGVVFGVMNGQKYGKDVFTCMDRECRWSSDFLWNSGCDSYYTEPIEFGWISLLYPIKTPSVTQGKLRLVKRRKTGLFYNNFSNNVSFLPKSTADRIDSTVSEYDHDAHFFEEQENSYHDVTVPNQSNSTFISNSNKNVSTNLELNDSKRLFLDSVNRDGPVHNPVSFRAASKYLRISLSDDNNNNNKSIE